MVINYSHNVHLMAIKDCLKNFCEDLKEHAIKIIKFEKIKIYQ